MDLDEDLGDLGAERAGFQHLWRPFGGLNGSRCSQDGLKTHVLCPLRFAIVLLMFLADIEQVEDAHFGTLGNCR